MTGRRRNLEHQNLFWRSWKEILHGNVFISIDICTSILIISDITGVIYKPMRANIPKIADMIMVPISARSEGKNLFIGIINSASADPGMVAAICIGSSAVRDFYWRIGGQALELVFDRSTMLRRIYGAVQSRLARTRKARASRLAWRLLYRGTFVSRPASAAPSGEVVAGGDIDVQAAIDVADGRVVAGMRFVNAECGCGDQ